jgi:hypothetical protein
MDNLLMLCAAALQVPALAAALALPAELIRKMMAPAPALAIPLSYNKKTSVVP